MNPESMTGHGRGESSMEGWNCSVECASVNRKGIEIAVSLPKTDPELEALVRDAVQKVFSRGRISVSVTLEGVAENGGGESIDRAAAKHALRELRSVREGLGLEGEISIELLLRMPGVLRASSGGGPRPEVASTLVGKALGQALDRLAAMRRREGKHLAADLLRRVKAIEAAVTAVRRRLPALLLQRRDTLRARLAELGCPLPADDPALARELALMAERSDVAEEITRLESHFVQFRSALKGEGPSGRTLDYLAQEMFREITTLGNKAGDPAVSQRVVQSKAELDRIREQVANLE